ncbi:MAG: hypothetical protein R3D98_14900 [Candidatus Krumholzibacteriia bacterium]
MGIRHVLNLLVPETRCWIPDASRQGDWYFLPTRRLDGRRDVTYHHDEAMRRDGRTLLVAEHLHREVSHGGHVCVYVRGRVVQAGQATLRLEGWHLVLPPETCRPCG